MVPAALCYSLLLLPNLSEYVRVERPTLHKGIMLGAMALQMGEAVKSN